MATTPNPATPIVSEFASALLEATRGIQEAMSLFKEATSFFGNVLKDVTDVMGKFSDAVGTVMGVVDRLAETIMRATEFVVQVGTALAEFGGKIVEVTTQIAGAIIQQISQQENYQRQLNSVLGTRLGDAIFDQVAQMGPQFVGSLDDMMSDAMNLIAVQAFRPTEGNVDEFRAAQGFLRDVAATTGVQRNILDITRRIFMGFDTITARTVKGFETVGGVDRVIHELNQAGFTQIRNWHDIRDAQRHGIVSTLDLAHAMENSMDRLHNATRTGQFALQMGSVSLSGIIENIGDLWAQLMNRFRTSIQTRGPEGEIRYERAPALQAFITQLNELNNLFSTDREVIAAFNSVMSELTRVIFGRLAVTDLRGTIISTLDWIHDEGIPMFETALDATKAFFQGVWQGLQPIITALGFNLAPEQRRNTIETFRRMGEQFGETLSRITIAITQLIPPLMDLANNISRIIGAYNSFVEMMTPPPEALPGRTDLHAIADEAKDRFLQGLAQGVGEGQNTALNELIAGQRDAQRAAHERVLAAQAAAQTGTGRGAPAATGHLPGVSHAGSSGGGGGTSIVNTNNVRIDRPEFHIHTDPMTAHELETRMSELSATTLTNIVDRILLSTAT